MSKSPTERLTFSGGIDLPADEFGRAIVPPGVREAIGMARDALAQAGHPGVLTVSFGGEAPARVYRARGSRNKADAVPVTVSGEGE